MNPYLEHNNAWHDFHERFIPFAAAMLEPQVGDGYVVKIDEHVYFHELDESERAFLGRADVFVSQETSQVASSGGVAAIAAPSTVRLPRVDAERVSVIQIRDRESWDIVTIVELLSPSNKVGSDRDVYLDKRGQILASPTHLVEIDLLRGGRRMPMTDLPECDYCVLVSRAEQRPNAGLWPIQLREKLPDIPIPRRAPDADIQLDLQVLLHRVYDESSYRKYIYSAQPVPPLSDEDTQWAESLIPVQHS